MSTKKKKTRMSEKSNNQRQLEQRTVEKVTHSGESVMDSGGTSQEVRSTEETVNDSVGVKRNDNHKDLVTGRRPIKSSGIDGPKMADETCSDGTILDSSNRTQKEVNATILADSIPPHEVSHGGIRDQLSTEKTSLDHAASHTGIVSKNNDDAATRASTISLKKGNISVWLAMAIIAIFAIVANLFCTNSNKAALSPPFNEERTHDLRHQLQLVFPSQAARFYNVIVTAVKGVQAESPQPTALLLMSNGSSDDQQTFDSMAECLAYLLEHHLTRKLPVIVVSGTHEQGLSPSESKYRIDELLEQHFSQGARVATVRGIEKLSLEEAKIFYKYCDHENSQRNNVIFVLTVDVGEAVDKGTEQSVEHTLLESWSRNLDEVSPILSRVTNNMLVLMPKRHFKCPSG